MSYRQNGNGPKNYVKKPKNERPRNARLTFAVFCSGVNKNGYEYDIQECYDILADLQKNCVYDNINIPVQIARELIDNEPGKRGQSTIGHVLAFVDNDQYLNEMDIMVYSNFVDKIDRIADLVVEPRVMVRDGHVTSILGLDIVQHNFDDKEDDKDSDVEEDDVESSSDAEEIAE